MLPSYRQVLTKRKGIHTMASARIFGALPTLETERLLLRKMQMYDLDVRPVQLKLAREARGKLARERTLITDNPM